jgi:hypothetical protein
MLDGRGVCALLHERIGHPAAVIGRRERSIKCRGHDRWLPEPLLRMMRGPPGKTRSENLAVRRIQRCIASPGCVGMGGFGAVPFRIAARAAWRRSSNFDICRLQNEMTFAPREGCKVHQIGGDGPERIITRLASRGISRICPTETATKQQEQI